MPASGLVSRKRKRGADGDGARQPGARPEGQHQGLQLPLVPLWGEGGEGREGGEGGKEGVEEIGRTRRGGRTARMKNCFHNKGMIPIKILHSNIRGYTYK